MLVGKAGHKGDFASHSLMGGRGGRATFMSMIFFFLSSFIYPGFHTGLALLLVFTEFPALVLNF